MSSLATHSAAALTGAALCAITTFSLRNEPPRPEDVSQATLSRLKAEIRTLQGRIETLQASQAGTRAMKSADVIKAHPCATASDTVRSEAGIPPHAASGEPSAPTAPPLPAARRSVVPGSTGTPHTYELTPRTQESLREQLSEAIGLTDFEWDRLEEIRARNQKALTELMFGDGHKPGLIHKIHSPTQGGKVEMTSPDEASMQALKDLREQSNLEARQLLGETRYEQYRKITGGHPEVIQGEGHGGEMTLLLETDSEEDPPAK